MSQVPSSLLDGQKTFAACEFGLDRRLTKAVSKLGYVYATLVQVHCIPLALQGKDLLVRARTGAGKTAAFALPVLQKILAAEEKEQRSIKALILVPTKELVAQTQAAFQELMYYCKDVVSLVALGGESISAQQAVLRDVPDILITTPGRLVTHIEAGNVQLQDSVKTLVMDEADLVLSFGYEKDIRTIFTHLPKTCQSFFMSATLSPELNQLKRAVLHNPAIVKLEEASTDGKLQQFYVRIPSSDKDLLLYALLKLGILAGKVLFFTNSVDEAYRLKLFFEQFSTKAAVVNGELPYNSRLHIIQQFNRGIIDYLIATDSSIDKDASESEASEVSDDDDTDSEEEEEEKPSKKKSSGYGVSRGIDFRGVSFVVNVDFPKSIKSYTHRIGRTARGGASGTALSLVSEDDQDQLDLLKKIQKAQDPIASNPVAGAQQALHCDDHEAEYIDQPAPLAFSLAEIDCFRYRVEDVRRAVTRIGVREARLEDVKKEILNSEKLKAHFEDNPRELQILQHDKAIGQARVQPHLAHIPSYLVPESLQPEVAEKKHTGGNRGGGKRRRLDNDPLHTFEYGSNGQSTAGRVRWQERHRRGKFNPKAKKHHHYTQNK